MRIVAGKFRGRVLKTPKGEATRPTSGMVRETLFNILAAKIPGARFLDLYAGCGSVALEALSRGADSAVFVEKSRAALACLRENITLLDVAGFTTVLPYPVERALEHLKARGEQFDIIFLDPPFIDVDAYLSVLGIIATTSLLTSDGILIAQHDARLSLPDNAGTLTRSRMQRIGDNALSFYQRKSGHTA